MEDLSIGTTDALKIAGLDRMTWNNTLAKGHIPPGKWPPPAGKGTVRQFNVDDTVALIALRMLLDLGAIPAKAGPMIAEFRAVLAASPECRSIGFCKTARGAVPIADPPADSDVLIPISVHKLRIAVRRLRAELLAADGPA
jgi:hypothetical protein